MFYKKKNVIISSEYLVEKVTHSIFATRFERSKRERSS